MIYYQVPLHAIRTDRGCVEEVLRLAAFFLSIYDKKVDFSWVGDAPVSVRGDLKKEHVLEEQLKAIEEKNTDYRRCRTQTTGWMLGWNLVL